MPLQKKKAPTGLAPRGLALATGSVRQQIGFNAVESAFMGKHRGNGTSGQERSRLTAW
jgi:hypothetical protein